jgi:putative peptide zinc metalloprotease protein
VGQEAVRSKEPDGPPLAAAVSPISLENHPRPEVVATNRKGSANHVKTCESGIQVGRSSQDRGRRIDGRLRSGGRQLVAGPDIEAWSAPSGATPVSPRRSPWSERRNAWEDAGSAASDRPTHASGERRRPLDTRLRSHGEVNIETAFAADLAPTRHRERRPREAVGAKPAGPAVTTAGVAPVAGHRVAAFTPDLTPPRLAEGVELIGEYQGSGFTSPVFLARRPDGQVIQLSHLLFLALDAIDGRRGSAELAAEVSVAGGRGLSEQGVELLLDKLAPLGLLDAGASVESLKDPMLGLRFRRTVVTERVVNRLSGLLQALFWPPVLATALLTFGVATWLIMSNGVLGSVRSVVAEPGQVLLVLALLMVSRLFHECGHAAACTYGGARPGIIGFGIYLVWPAFFTNVTDAYRLDRRGRLRTDLGGVYFNLLFVLVLSALYFATGVPALVVAVLFTQLEMLQQFLPIVRLDGYYILGDLVGVPELFGRVKPILTSLVSRGPTHPRVQELRPRVRIIVTLWVLITIPLLAGYLIIFVATLPQVAGTLYDAVRSQATGLARAASSLQFVAVIVDLFSLVTLLIVPLGTMVVLASMARGFTQLSLRWSQGQPIRRAAIIFIAVLVVAGVGTWWRVQLP